MNIFIIASVIFVGHARILFPFEQEILSREGLSAISFSFDDQDSERTSTETVAVEMETTEKPALTASCPEDAPWCDAPVEYPDNIILKAVNKQKKIVQGMFENKSAAGRNAPATESLAERLGEFTVEEEEGSSSVEDLENICDVKTSYITPRAAKNKDGKFRFIVNHPDGDEEYTQLVRVSVCSAAGGQCGAGLGLGLERTMCRQEYSDHKLVSLSEEGEELVVDTFSFPSCCTCLVNTFSDFL